jgi:Xaa-Pro aminopeptidase
MTRTIAIGNPCQKLCEIYQIVLDAHNLAKKALAPGKSTKEIDALARDHISSCGYGQYFGHGLGHGVGIDIHELPVLSYRSDVTLQKGNVVTVEPGIYIPDLGGVRIENMCYITEDGYCDITKSDNKLIII